MAVYRASDATNRAKEVFFHHNAGLDGHGGSSYIDTLILREKDANTNWTSQFDLVMERRGQIVSVALRAWASWKFSERRNRSLLLALN